MPGRFNYRSGLLLMGLVFFGWIACQENKDATEKSRSLAKFEPPSGHCLVFVGQELEAIGGLQSPYNDGYIDYFEKPAGWTMYSGINPGDTSFGYVMQGLDGIFETADWGDGASNMSLQLQDDDFDGMALAIGFWMVNHEKEVAMGLHDSLLTVFGEWLKSLGSRPVFLRIGYEFAGEWNGYNREEYINAFRHIRDFLENMSVVNVTYVWQSHGWGEPLDLLESWYPGDEYVDWCAFSFFNRWDETNMIEFARMHQKPVFIAEASPTLPGENVKIDNVSKPTMLGDSLQAQEAWDIWFTAFFEMIEENQDVVKAFSYINCNWKSHPMWKGNPVFENVDARLQINPIIADKWNSKMQEDQYLQTSDLGDL